MNRQFDDLLEKLKTQDPSTDENLVRDAYDFCMKAHGSQLRASGDPYFTHPLAVAQILAELKMDHQSVITGFLHDTIEDTLVSIDEIKERFGRSIAHLVDGVTKLSQLELQSEHTKQAENFRKLVLAMSSDIRVLIIKLADRLHNMRTLHYITSDEKKRRISRETMDIYAPLAERMGMHKLKDELEEIAFSYLNPEAKESLQTRLNFLYENADYTVEAIIEDIVTALKEHHINAQVNGRQKTPYSIWRKMQHKRIAFEQLADIMAFRVTVDNVADCYQTLGVLHNRYLVLPGRFKDYISTPKPNGYQSLHTVLIGPFNSRIEIQIRTKEMHIIAEYGMAAHWQYKQNISHDGKQYAWLRGLLDILEQTSSPEEFMEHTRLEMFQDQVFCFTPKGELISLPSGATCIDFAYAVHSEVGDHATAVRINGRMMPLRTVLNNGDQVEIITSKTQTPSPTWERFVVTGKARSRIRKFIRLQQRGQFSSLGKSILQKAFQHENVEWTEKMIDRVSRHLKYSHPDDLYAAIGQGIQPVKEIFHLLFPDAKSASKSSSPEHIPSKKASQKEKDFSISIKGLISGMAVHFAGCCHPLPGDKIVGVVKTGKGVAIHTHDCEVVKIYTEKDRLLDLSWGDYLSSEEKFVGRIKATFINKQGVLATFSTAISKQGGNIANLKITNRTLHFWDIILDIEVRNVEHLNAIIARLRTLPITNQIERG